jgi:nitronate monooxygenase
MTTIRFRTPLCDLLDIELPIMLAAMAPDISDPKLVAAVSEAGGIGVLACADKDPEQIVAMAAETRKLTGKPFGMDIGLPARVETYGHDFRSAAAQAKIPASHLAMRERFLSERGIPFDDDAARATPGMSSVASFKLGETFSRGQVKAILQARPALFVSALGDPSFMVAEAHALGIKVMSLVGKVKDAVSVAHGGIDAVICTGTAAGGHSGDVDGMVLVPHVVERVAPLPVVAGGGIVDGRGLAAALALGAIGVWVGSRFIASQECSAPDWYKQRIVEAGDGATVRSKWYTGKTCRHLRSEWDTAWDACGLPALPMPDQALLTTPDGTRRGARRTPPRIGHLLRPGRGAHRQRAAGARDHDPHDRQRARHPATRAAGPRQIQLKPESHHHGSHSHPAAHAQARYAGRGRRADRRRQHAGLRRHPFAQWADGADPRNHPPRHQGPEADC